MKPLITIAEWVRVRDWLNPSIEKTFGTHTEEDVFLMCATGQNGSRLWVFENSCAITEFQQFPQMKVCNLFLVGGDLEELLSKEPEISKFAKENGCSRLTGAGRNGWKRTHPDGWNFSCTALYKDIV